MKLQTLFCTHPSTGMHLQDEIMFSSYRRRTGSLSLVQPTDESWQTPGKQSQQCYINYSSEGQIYNHRSFTLFGDISITFWLQMQDGPMSFPESMLHAHYARTKRRLSPIFFFNALWLRGLGIASVSALRSQLARNPLDHRSLVEGEWG